ncbi:MAG: hypothetical protein IJI14_08670 [Anaerolineaceae bacterium]|nr:hypothetical protein [Anaerolineaceae bacterium]
MESKINWTAIRAQFKFDVQTGCPILDEYEYNGFAEFDRKMRVFCVPPGIRMELIWAHFLRKAGTPGIHYEGGTENDTENGKDMSMFGIIGSDVTCNLGGKSDCVSTGIIWRNEVKVEIGIRYGNSYGNVFNMPVTVFGVEFPNPEKSTYLERVHGAELAAYAQYTLLTSGVIIPNNPYKALAEAVFRKDQQQIKRAKSALRRWMMSFKACAA